MAIGIGGEEFGFAFLLFLVLVLLFLGTSYLY